MRPMTRLFDRLREPSTYAGLASLLAGVGLFGLDEGAWQAIFVALGAVAGVAAMIMEEKGRG